jgi:hypothetical protein
LMKRIVMRAPATWCAHYGVTTLKRGATRSR